MQRFFFLAVGDFFLLTFRGCQVEFFLSTNLLSCIEWRTEEGWSQQIEIFITKNTKPSSRILIEFDVNTRTQHKFNKSDCLFCLFSLFYAFVEDALFQSHTTFAPFLCFTLYGFNVNVFPVKIYFVARFLSTSALARETATVIIRKCFVCIE